MSDPRQTDERLRSWLNTNQPARERMCIAILETEPGYTHVEPRRPEGGPDGGRDIQCLRDGQKCFGAVGFKNDADGTDAQFREIKKKFEADLDAALEAEPELKSFVFLTNIDLTPVQREQFEKTATNRRVRADIYWRERMRIALDRPEGYAIRFTYLGISLSDAEQKTFFAIFGKELQAAISGKLVSLEQRIEEIQFLNWKRGRCREIRFDVHLKTMHDVRGTKNDPYRFALRLSRVGMYGEGEVLLGVYSVIRQDGNRADYENKSFIFNDSDLVRTKEKFAWLPHRVRMVGQPFREVSAGVQFADQNGDGGVVVNRLAEYVVYFSCDAAWVDRVAKVELWYDEYLAVEFLNDGRCLGMFDDIRDRIYLWPEEVTELRDRPVVTWSTIGAVLDRPCHRKSSFFDS